MGDITVTLLNQLQDKNHFSTIISITADNGISADSGGKGNNLFIAQTELGYDTIKNTQYLKDDSLYFSVSVKVWPTTSLGWRLGHCFHEVDLYSAYFTLNNVWGISAHANSSLIPRPSSPSILEEERKNKCEGLFFLSSSKIDNEYYRGREEGIGMRLCK